MTIDRSDNRIKDNLLKIIRFMASAGLLAAFVSFLLIKMFPDNKPPARKKELPILILDVLSENSPFHNSLHYELTKGKNSCVIKPVNEYLTAVHQGDQLIPPHFTYSPWELNFKFPCLDIKIVNNSDDTVFIHQAVFKIKKSWLDQRPIPIINRRGYNMKLPLQNIGWGPMQNTVIHFSLVDPDTDIDEIDDFNFSVEAGSIKEKWLENDLSAFFYKAGLDTQKIKELRAQRRSDSNHDVAKMTESEYEALLKSAYGPFYSGSALIFGRIEYDSVEKSGRIERKVNDFTSIMSLDPILESGVPVYPSKKYDAKFKVSGNDYEVKVPVSHSIKPKGEDRILFQIASDKSSFHEFNLSLVFNNSEELLSDPISLDLFLCRRDAMLLGKKAVP